MTAKAVTADSILDFWFEDAGPKRWFTADPAFDAQVRRRFGRRLQRFLVVDNVEGDAWLAAPKSALALVILLDQFPRNVWRGSNKAFALDGLALQAATILVDRGFDEALTADRRVFAYMPFMHSESLADQDRGVALCEARLDPEEATSTLRHACAHRDLIVRFGRFPHRNAALGRESTPEEAAFLAGGGYQPGAKRPAKSAPRKS